MNDIVKIVIKGGSGYCRGSEAYYDKIVLDENSISYEYKPDIISEINPKRKWSYRTTSPIFKNIFDDIKKTMPGIIAKDETLCATDVGIIEFIISYTDGTKIKKSFFLSAEELNIPAQGNRHSGEVETTNPE